MRHKGVSDGQVCTTICSNHGTEPQRLHVVSALSPTATCILHHGTEPRRDTCNTLCSLTTKFTIRIELTEIDLCRIQPTRIISIQFRFEY